jgi:transposase
MKRYSEADKAWLVEEWEKSGKSKWAFVKELGLNYQTFSNWTQKPEGAQGFVEAISNLEAVEEGEDERTRCALVVEHGPFRVHLPAGVTPKDLAVVVQALRQAMTVDLNAVKIYVRPGYTDLRKAAKGLAVSVQDQMKLDPLSGSVCLFCNKERRLLKAVWRDKTGFWLAQKRLEEERHPWPENSREAEELDAAQLGMLLSGIDFWKAHKPLRYRRVG